MRSILLPIALLIAPFETTGPLLRQRNIISVLWRRIEQRLPTSDYVTKTTQKQQIYHLQECWSFQNLKTTPLVRENILHEVVDVANCDAHQIDVDRVAQQQGET